jgi:hypothetical protein
MLCAVTSAALAQAPQPDLNSSGFASEWRVTGFIRQGKTEEASLERQGMMSRFVKEGDHLPGGIIVLDVRYSDRTVVLAKGKETAILQQETTMTAPPAPPSVVKAPPPPAVKKPTVDKATAMQDESGKWVVAFPNGKSLDMQSYVDRHGGMQEAIQHVQDLISREQDPERLAYRQQQLYALQQMAANPASTSGNTTATSATGTSTTTTTSSTQTTSGPTPGTRRYPNSNVVF